MTPLTIPDASHNLRGPEHWRRVRRPAARSGSLLLVVVFLLTACAPASGRSTARTAPRATETATPLAPLAWTPVTLPERFTGPGGQLAVSPVDGHDAWMCQSTSENTYVFWQTTDAGKSWRQTGGFSFTAPMAGAWCIPSA